MAPADAGIESLGGGGGGSGFPPAVYGAGPGFGRPGAAAASAAGHGWVDYVWPRPGTTTPVAKSTYATHVTGPDGKGSMVGGGGSPLHDRDLQKEWWAADSTLP